MEKIITHATATGILWSKKIHSKTAKGVMQNKWQNLLKTEQSVKTNFFEALNFLILENSKLLKLRIHLRIRHKKGRFV